MKHIRLLDHDAVDDHSEHSDSSCSADSASSLSSAASTATAVATASPHLIAVECENGSRFRTKHVVVTCSVNYLKQSYSRLFDTRLITEQKLAAIDAVKMGTVDKIFLFYDDLSTFFPDVDAVHPIFIEDVTDASAASIVCDDDDTVAKSSVPWYHKVFTFDRFYENMLMVWVTGWQAKHAEKLADVEISRTLTDLLRRTLNNPNVPEPKRIVKSVYSLIEHANFSQNIFKITKNMYIFHYLGQCGALTRMFWALTVMWMSNALL